MFHKTCSILGKSGHALIALALSLVLLFGLSEWSVENARAVKLDQACSLTVSPGDIEDLANAEVVLDLYQVAKAIPVSGYDTYAYDTVAPYQELESILDDGENLTNQVFQTLAQQAAEITFNSGSTVTKTIDGAPVNEKIPDLEAGLYLLVARGPEINNYVKTIQDETGAKKLATVAWSDEFVYSFLPELISLPGKAADADGGVNTANPGEWIYDAAATLKPEQSVRFGSLEIVKKLTSYNTEKAASFVFEIEAYTDETKAERVYSNVVSIDFSAPGQKSVVLKDVIPVGAYVEVTEVYSGATYSLVSDATVSTVIQAEELASVSFTNDYNHSGNHGGAVTNHFDYSEESGWGWTQE